MSSWSGRAVRARPDSSTTSWRRRRRVNDLRAATTSGGGIALLGGTLLPSGVQTYYVGGTLNVGANQPAGDYSGTFQLTVNYL